jgi:hypothetical protein
MKLTFEQSGDGLEPESVIQHRVEGKLKTCPKLEIECETKSEKKDRMKTGWKSEMKPGTEHEAQSQD